MQENISQTCADPSDLVLQLLESVPEVVFGSLDSVVYIVWAHS